MALAMGCNEGQAVCQKPLSVSGVRRAIQSGARAVPATRMGVANRGMIRERLLDRRVDLHLQEQPLGLPNTAPLFWRSSITCGQLVSVAMRPFFNLVAVARKPYIAHFS
jgi:hypothetical protein